MSDASFHEDDLHRPIRELGLRIEGTRLEPIIEAFRQELRAAGLVRVTPRFYLSTEWGVPFGTVAIAIPFYLASQRLTELHERQAGHVEGADREDVLRYLRHEMGHVVGYAYRLHERVEWTTLFGPMRRAYRERWRPRPFSRRHVRHLPGWYAQKHPDEDWAETFAVWMTPGSDWRGDYAAWPDALAKLEWCDRAMAELRDAEPLVTDDTLDEDVAEIHSSPSQHAAAAAVRDEELPLHLDAALRSAFAQATGAGGGETASAAALLRRMRPALAAEIYRWTGHFPERAARLVDHVAERCETLGLRYPAQAEAAATITLTALLSALAMTWVSRGRYEP